MQYSPKESLWLYSVIFVTVMIYCRLAMAQQHKLPMDSTLQVTLNNCDVPTEVSFHGGDSTASYVATLREVTIVRCPRSELTDVGLAELASLPKLVELSISSPHISPKGLLKFRDCRSLRRLNVDIDYGREKPLKDPTEYVQAISELGQLTHLTLRASHISKNGTKFLSKLQSLQKIELSDTDFGDDDVASLSTISSLQAVGLSSTKIGDMGLEHLTKIKSLKSLDIGDTRVTSIGLLTLANCTKLEQLGVSHNRVDGSSLIQIAKNNPLRRIYAARTDIGNEIVELVRACPKLEELTILNIKATEETIRMIRREYPRLEVDADFE